MIISTTTQAIRTTRRKIAALINIGKQSLRSIGQIIDRPKSTVHRHLKSHAFRDQYPESYFWETEAGEAWLRRMVLGELFIFGMQHAVGADSLSDFFKLIRINTHVGVSANAMLGLLNRMESLLIYFQDFCEKSLPPGTRKAVLAMDETFFGSLLILVLMDLSSGYLLLESIEDDRSFDTWLNQAKPRLEALGIDVGHAISDRAKALIKLAVDGFDCASGADVFHEQYGLSRWLGSALGRRKTQAEKRRAAAQKAVDNANETNKAELEAHHIDTVAEYAQTEIALQDYRTNLAGISEDLHPFSLDTPLCNTAATVTEKLVQRADAIENIAKEHGIADKYNAMQKFRNQIPSLATHVSFWWLWVEQLLLGFGVDQPTYDWLTGKLLPVVYWHYHRYKTKNPSQRKRYQSAWRHTLEVFKDDSFWESLGESEQRHWLEWAEWMVRQFHRSSSAVEGRNGHLSQLYHKGRGVTKTRLKARTVIHNYWEKRSDDTTAAERLFNTQFPDLFEWLVDQMGELPLPRKSSRATVRNPLNFKSVPA